MATNKQLITGLLH
jgi:hypothetical protein